MSPETVILIPLMRRWRIPILLKSLRSSASAADYLVLFITSSPECYEAVQDQEILPEETVHVVADQGGSWGERLNLGYRLTDQPFLFLGADDVKFHYGWLDHALDRMRWVDGVVVVNDLLNPAGTMALVSRRYIDEESGCVDTPGVIIYPGYRHNYSDNELFETARSRGRLDYCEKAVVEHLHWLVNKAPYDEVYEEGDNARAADAALFESRKHLWSR